MNCLTQRTWFSQILSLLYFTTILPSFIVWVCLGSHHHQMWCSTSGPDNTLGVQVQQTWTVLLVCVCLQGDTQLYSLRPFGPLAMSTGNNWQVLTVVIINLKSQVLRTFLRTSVEKYKNTSVNETRCFCFFVCMLWCFPSVRGVNSPPVLMECTVSSVGTYWRGSIDVRKNIGRFETQNQTQISIEANTKLIVQYSKYSLLFIKSKHRCINVFIILK